MVSRSGNRIAAVIIAIFIAVPCATFGACWAVIGSSESTRGWDSLSLTIAAVSFVLFAVIVLWIVKLWRS